MNFNNFTLKAQEAIQAAVELATSQQQQAIEPGHILKALVLSDDAVVPFVLKKLNINLDFLSQKADDLIATYPKIVSSSDGPYFSNDTTKLIEAAKSKLKSMGDEFIAIEHSLLGM